MSKLLIADWLRGLCPRDLIYSLSRSASHPQAPEFTRLGLTSESPRLTCSELRVWFKKCPDKIDQVPLHSYRPFSRSLFPSGLTSKTGIWSQQVIWEKLTQT
nr:hypothetical protein HmN_000328400 [Hymenolepis microstoma]